MVTWAGTEVWQLEATINPLEIFIFGYEAISILVVHLKYDPDDVVLFALRDGGGALVKQAVGLADILSRPFAGAVVIMQREKGSGVEGGYMVLLCMNSGQIADLIVLGRKDRRKGGEGIRALAKQLEARVRHWGLDLAFTTNLLQDLAGRASRTASRRDESLPAMWRVAQSASAGTSGTPCSP